MAMSYEKVEEMPHFEKASFRVNKKIFLTLDEKTNRACVKLSEIDQDVFSTMAKEMIYPVPNKWGKQGWTFVELSSIKKEVFKELLITSYCTVAPKALSEKYRE